MYSINVAQEWSVIAYATLKVLEIPAPDIANPPPPSSAFFEFLTH